jgi:hypothetical protein
VGAPLGTLNLQDQVVKAHRVIPINGALESLREDHFQVPVPAGYKRRSSLSCRNREATVELGDGVLIGKHVGRFQSSDPAQSQLLRQPSLPGGEAAFRPPYEYESRLSEMFPGAFQNLRLLALDAYDLALTKLERNIERDRSDVRFLARAIPFDIGLLRERYQTELRPYLGNPKREDLTLKLWIEAIEEDRAVESNRLHESGDPQ